MNRHAKLSFKEKINYETVDPYVATNGLNSAELSEKLLRTVTALVSPSLDLTTYIEEGVTAPAKTSR